MAKSQGKSFKLQNEESSESEIEMETARILQSANFSSSRILDTSSLISTREGFLMKQTSSFQRWKRRYFKLRGSKLSYSKNPDSVILDEFDLSNLCCNESKIRNINFTFQITTPTRSLVLAADNHKEMDDWCQALKSTNRVGGEYYDTNPTEQYEFLSGVHHWFSTTHARPTYCNICRDALSGVTSHGLSCEVCKFKVHKRCVSKTLNNCKWTTLASVGKDIIEDVDGNLIMPHQWMEGNLPVSAKCIHCDKTCGSVLRLQDWRCLWCRATVHTQCRHYVNVRCPLGANRVSIVQPTSLHSIGSDEAWDVVKPQGSFSPLLVFVNSKSGDNQGIKFLRRFKQLLNPAQVFDLMSSGPSFGLRLFRHFELFRILICSGDGTVGWVLSEIDRLNMHKQCQIAVLPLGTGNDLARVLGWGSSCDDDANIPQLLERYEKSSTKMLDRWSIMVFERDISLRRGMSISHSPDAILAWYLQSIVENDDFQVVLTSTRKLVETVNEFIGRIMEANRDDDSLVVKCNILREKVDFLLDFLKEDEQINDETTVNSTTEEGSRDKRDRSVESERKRRFSFGKSEKDKINTKERTSRQLKRSEREAVQNRASSLRRIITDIIEECDTKTAKCEEKITSKSNVRFVPTSSSENSPCASPSLITSATPYISCISPLPDVRRESFDEVFMNTLAIPVPRQFADESRRNSRVQGGISEEEEDNYVESCKAAENLLEVPTSDNSLHFKFDLPTINRYTENKSINEDDEEDENVNDLSAFRPIEVMERNHLRNLAQKKTNYEQIEPPTINNSSMNMMLHSKTETSNTLQVPIISLPYMMEKPPPKFDMTGYSILTESPQHDKSSSEEIVGESSDVVSAISNEECSVSSEILDQKVSETFPINAGDIIQDLNDDEKIGHIDSPESEMTDALHGGESLIDDMSSVLGLALHDITSNDDTTTLCTAGTSKIRKASFKAKKREQFGFENKAFDLSDITSQLPTATEPIRYCSLAQFVEGNDIARKSFKKYQKYASKTSSSSTMTTKTTTKSNEHKNQEDEEYFPSKEDDEKTEKQIEYEKNHPMNTIKIQIQGSVTDLSMETEFEISNNVNNVGRIDYRTADLTDNSITHDSIIADTPSPKISEHLRQLRASEYRRHSSHTPQTTTLAPKEVDVNRRHSNHNPNLLSYDSERVKFLNCSPAASRRISCGTLFKNADRISFNSTKNLFLTRKSISKERKNSTKDDCEKKKEEKTLKPKTLPIINPLVRLPSWPNIANSQTGAGFISKCLLANADTLCSMACPLMNPDEPLDEGFYERCVMNNYFGIGIDAKITLDFHIKREEHPEKCRSRAKNYMWYGVLGSKQWLQKTYKNLEQRVQLECDGQRIPLPSLQGIVILNIPSFMGGTNFWGSSKEDDIFLAPSFDDRILEVVAVFGSVQMAACRLINLQHHRIAQCQSIQINILGDEGVPIQVDGEAWLQPPGMIRIIHKNRVQMICRNRSLEVSLKSWHEKQRQHSISIAREQTSLTSEYSTALGDSLFTERETYLLLNFIESVSTLVKWVKFLIISHPSLQPDLYVVACKTADSLEAIHPGGKLVDGPSLRTKLTELVGSTRQLYESTCELLRERGQSIIMREDLETKLSVALANIEMELRKCSLQKSEDGTMKIYLNILAPNNDDVDHRKKSKPFWNRFRHNREHQQASGVRTARSSSREAVSNWGVNEVITWLEAMQLSEYIDSFIKNDIRGKELLTLARRDLKDLGVTKVGHVKRILQAIKDLQAS